MEQLAPCRELFLVYRDKLQTSAAMPSDTLAPAYVSRQQLVQLADALTMAATKCGSLLRELEQAGIVVLQVFDLLWLSAGPSWRKVLRVAFLDLLNSILALLEGLVQVHSCSGARLEKAKQAVAPLTGVVWTACTNLKQMPLTNKDIILIELNREAATIRDATDELSAAIQKAQKVTANSSTSDDDLDQDFDADTLEPEALALANSLMLILKATNSITKSLLAPTETGLIYPLNESHTEALEAVLTSVREIAAATDDAACALYAFETRKVAIMRIKGLGDSISRLLAMLRNHPALESARMVLQRIDISNELIRKGVEDLKL